MKKIMITTFLLVFFSQLHLHAVAPYVTPNTGLEYSFEDLVNCSSGAVIKEGTIYVIQDNLTISPLDALVVTENITVKIFTDKTLTINGARWEVDAPVQAFFTHYTEGGYYATISIEEDSYVRLNHATFTYGSGIRVIESDFEMNNCTMNEHNSSSQASGAISATRGKVIVKNSTFKNNVQSAFSSGANIGTTFEITNCHLENNVTENSNRPQINVGPCQTGEITKIVGNTIIGNRTHTMVGGIGASSLMSMATTFWVEGNMVIDNRYGITFTGTNITGTIKGNILTDNNVEVNPMNGGSGINITATAGNTHAIITQNVISGHFWGITLLGNYINYSVGPTANIGNVSVPENDPEYNIGLNIFFNNGNNGELYDLYNNNPNDVMAQNNHWGVSKQSEELIRTVIRDKVNDERYGVVTFMPPYIICDPISNLSVVYTDNCDADISWDEPAPTVEKTYNLYRDASLIASDLTETSYTDTEFDPLLPHTWAVTVVCEETVETEPLEKTLESCIAPSLVTITVVAEGGGSVEIVGYEDTTVEVEEGTVITVKATPDENNSFLYWSTDGEAITDENTYSFPATKDITLVAHFTGVGIVSTTLNNQLRVYPNPTTGELRITNYELGIGTLSEVEVEIFDIYGRKQSSNHLIPESSNHLINVAHLPAGIYFLKVGIKTVKIVKQ